MGFGGHPKTIKIMCKVIRKQKTVHSIHQNYSETETNLIKVTCWQTRAALAAQGHLFGAMNY